MIVRISGEDQYVLPDSAKDRLNELDSAVTAVVERGQPDGFAEAYAELLDYVRTRGKRFEEDELQGSDLILPPADLSFEEAAREFTGEGLIPD